MKYIKRLPEVAEIIAQYPITPKEQALRKDTLQHIENILSGKSNKKLLIIGPCSADREDAVIEYTQRLHRLQEKVSEVFCIIPRVYTSKPRTTGSGYKGLLHRPQAASGHDDMISGLIATRKMHQAVIKNAGMFTSDEMLYPEMLGYLSDLLVYVAVGARSVENQQHRLTASGLEIPTGMKNPTSGDFNVMLNAIVAAQNIQNLMYNGWAVQTAGNPYAHAILRGYMDSSGISRPNYHYEHLEELYDKYYKMNLRNQAVIVDCNHCNSNKRYDAQARIAEEVLQIGKRNKTLGKFVKGVMIESYLEDGAQLVGGCTYGQSITDPCLGWNKTEKAVLEMADNIC